MPTAGTALWKLADGDFEYDRWEILDVEQNPVALKPLDPARADSATGRKRRLLAHLIE